MVPHQIDVNNPVILSVWAGIFQWSFQSNKFFPQTDGNFPTLYFCSPNFYHKLMGIIQHYTLVTKFFPQTDGNYPTLYFVHWIFPTNRHDFSHKPTWFSPQTNMNFSKKCSRWESNLQPISPANSSLSSQPPRHVSKLSKKGKPIWFGEDYKYTARWTGAGGCNFESWWKPVNRIE